MWGLITEAAEVNWDTRSATWARTPVSLARHLLPILLTLDVKLMAPPRRAKWRYARQEEAGGAPPLSRHRGAITRLVDQSRCHVHILSIVSKSRPDHNGSSLLTSAGSAAKSEDLAPLVVSRSQRKSFCFRPERLFFLFCFFGAYLPVCLFLGVLLDSWL